MIESLSPDGYKLVGEPELHPLPFIQECGSFTAKPTRRWLMSVITF